MNRQLLLEIIPAPAPTLDSTVIGENGAAIDAAKCLQAGRALYFWGSPGSGRSHILRAMGHRQPAVHFDCTSLAPQMMALATQSEPFCQKLVTIDDIQEMSATQQASVFALYNRWRACATTESAFALVVTGDLAPMMMPLREDLRTRLGWDLVFRLEPLSDTEKFAALTHYAQTQGLPLSIEVINWMLMHYSRDIRQLFALVNALDQYSLSKHRTVTVPLLRTMLADREFLQST